jgi:mannose-6-phosphate isomerase-like protein (cupin superfamily)
METFNIDTILASMEKKPLNKEVFCNTDHLKAHVMRLESGTSIPPCKMDNDVLFYILRGEGTITVDDETSVLGTGDCIVVPHPAETRSIHAVTDLEILAVQGKSDISGD